MHESGHKVPPELTHDGRDFWVLLPSTDSNGTTWEPYRRRAARSRAATRDEPRPWIDSARIGLRRACVCAETVARGHPGRRRRAVEASPAGHLPRAEATTAVHSPRGREGWRCAGCGRKPSRRAVDGPGERTRARRHINGPGAPSYSCDFNFPRLAKARGVFFYF